MSDQRLHELLGQLHDELEHRSLGDDDRQALRTAMQDIQERLENEHDHPWDDLTDHLHEAATRFTSEHPTLASGLRRLIDILNKSGI